MSVGNVTQGVLLNDTKLTLVLGNNLDLGGDGSRNGMLCPMVDLACR